MTIEDIYKRFPAREDCIKHLEQVRWDCKPFCPNCESRKYTPLTKESRYHCHSCNSSYSVLTQSPFRNVKCDLQKLFYGIRFYLTVDSKVSARKLSSDIGTTKDTAWLMLQKIYKADSDDRELLININVF